LKPFVLLAQLETVFAEQPTKSYSRGLKEILLIIGIAFVLSAALFIWAAFWRKRRRASSRHHGNAHPGGESLPAEHKRHRRRRRKSSHPDKRPRNPTLAETGGLPPPRPEDAVTPSFNATDASQPNHNPQKRL
jgi:hypothetical protein